MGHPLDYTILVHRSTLYYLKISHLVKAILYLSCPALEVQIGSFGPHEAGDAPDHAAEET